MASGGGGAPSAAVEHQTTASRLCQFRDSSGSQGYTSHERQDFSRSREALQYRGIDASILFRTYVEHFRSILGPTDDTTSEVHRQAQFSVLMWNICFGIFGSFERYNNFCHEYIAYRKLLYDGSTSANMLPTLEQFIWEIVRQLYFEPVKFDIWLKTVANFTSPSMVLTFLKHLRTPFYESERTILDGLDVLSSRDHFVDNVTCKAIRGFFYDDALGQYERLEKDCSISYWPTAECRKRPFEELDMLDEAIGIVQDDPGEAGKQQAIAPPALKKAIVEHRE